MTLGERIRKARKGKYTQAELADILGIHEMTLRRWELWERSPDADVLPKLSEALGISISELMGENNDSELNEENLSNLSLRKISSPTRSDKLMLVYERDGERIELPPTEQGYEIMNNIAKAIVTRMSTNNVMTA